MVEPVAYRLLIKMLAVRLPDPLTAQQPPEKGNRRVGNEIERLRARVNINMADQYDRAVDLHVGRARHDVRIPPFST